MKRHLIPLILIVAAVLVFAAIFLYIYLVPGTMAVTSEHLSSTTSASALSLLDGWRVSAILDDAPWEPSFCKLICEYTLHLPDGTVLRYNPSNGYLDNYYGKNSSSDADQHCFLSEEDRLALNSILFAYVDPI